MLRYSLLSWNAVQLASVAAMPALGVGLLVASMMEQVVTPPGMPLATKLAAQSGIEKL